jgi:hypothetical protein
VRDSPTLTLSLSLCIAESRQANKFSNVDEFIIQQAELKKHPQPSEQDLGSLKNWHYNHQNKTINSAETSYLSSAHDLLSVVPKEKTPLRKLLEQNSFFIARSFWHQRKKPVLPHYDKDLNVITYISDKRVDNFVAVLIVVIGMVMLIAPMWVLEFIDSEVKKLGAITAFILGFFAMVSYAISARPFEVLTAIAA